MRLLISSSAGDGEYTARGGKIDFALFLRLMDRAATTEQDALDAEHELKDAFRVLDAQGRGYVGAEEMQALCKRLGEDLELDQVHDMIGEALANFEGKVYYDGFVKTLIT